MKKYIIYRFTNTINHKCYIGFTTQTIERRTYQHYYIAKRYSKCHFHKALNKYSKNDWLIEVLEESYAESDEIKSRERYFVQQNDSYENGYNSTEGGDDFLSSEYQRELQKMRVENGTHPFLGGAIQSETMKKRHLNGEFDKQI